MSWHHQVSDNQDEIRCEFIFQNLLNNMYVTLPFTPTPLPPFTTESGGV
jgi:hypothetical protein